MFILAVFGEEQSFVIRGRMSADVSEGRKPGRGPRRGDSSSVDMARSGRCSLGTTWLENHEC